MSGKANHEIKGDALASLRGADVEVRTVGGAIIRGELVSVGPEWLQVARRTGRLALVRCAAVNSVTDERAPGLNMAGARAADAALDSDEA